MSWNWSPLYLNLRLYVALWGVDWVYGQIIGSNSDLTSYEFLLIFPNVGNISLFYVKMLEMEIEGRCLPYVI